MLVAAAKGGRQKDHLCNVFYEPGVCKYIWTGAKGWEGRFDSQAEVFGRVDGHGEL